MSNTLFNVTDFHGPCWIEGSLQGEHFVKEAYFITLFSPAVIIRNMGGKSLQDGQCKGRGHVQLLCSTACI